VSFGTTICFANKHFPDIVDANHAFKTTNWLFGCHPYHNYSLVATLGATRPKEVFYGNNRADFSFIPGNVAPGILSENLITLKTMTIGHFCGDKTREPLVVIPVT
jgi:endoglucanase